MAGVSRGLVARPPGCSLIDAQTRVAQGSGSKQAIGVEGRASTCSTWMVKRRGTLKGTHRHTHGSFAKSSQPGVERMQVWQNESTQLGTAGSEEGGLWFPIPNDPEGCVRAAVGFSCGLRLWRGSTPFPVTGEHSMLLALVSKMQSNAASTSTTHMSHITSSDCDLESSASPPHCAQQAMLPSSAKLPSSATSGRIRLHTCAKRPASVVSVTKREGRGGNS